MRRNYTHFGTLLEAYPYNDDVVGKVLSGLWEQLKKSGLSKETGVYLFGRYHIMRNYMPYISSWTKDYHINHVDPERRPVKLAKTAQIKAGTRGSIRLTKNLNPIAGN